MAQPIRHQPDPQRDLVLTRDLDIPPAAVWRAWTQPELLKQWFAPKPWTTVDAEIDARPGGIFRTVMRSPEGKEFPGAGCVLEAVENEKFVWTGALGPGYRPLSLDTARAENVPFLFTAIITMEPHGSGTRYTVIAVHSDEDGKEKHAAMGFHQGWGAALDQMIALAKDTMAGA